MPCGQKKIVVFVETWYLFPILLVLTVLTGLVFSEYLLSGQGPTVKEVNDEEPLFPAVPFLNVTLANKVSYSCFLECLGPVL